MPEGARSGNGGSDSARLFDSHAHFFTDDIARYPLNAANKREGEEGLTRRILAEPGTPERVFAEWDAHGVRRGAGVQYNNAYKTDNRYLLDVADLHPDRIGAVVILNPLDPATPARLRDMAGRGVVGLRLVGFTDDNARAPWLEAETTLEVLAEAERLGVAVVLMIRLQPGQPADAALATVRAIAQRFPRLTFVMDHFAWPAKVADPSLALTPAHWSLAPCANLHFKLTSINLEHFHRAGMDAAAFVRRAADLYGADRLMWGSDFGNTLRPYGEMAAEARQAAARLNEAEARAFLHDTADKIFGRD